MIIRTSIQLDSDAFSCAVEQQRAPGLCGKPYAVDGRSEARANLH
jgi:hypothetical protein